jgi:hypothetical protein
VKKWKRRGVRVRARAGTSVHSETLAAAVAVVSAVCTGGASGRGGMRRRLRLRVPVFIAIRGVWPGWR